MSTKKQQSRFPTEIVDLPSKGLLYPEGHALRDGKVEVKYMTAKEEDILTSIGLIEKGLVIDELLKSLVQTKFNFGDITIGDKNAVMLSARILGYGKEYVCDVTCPNCSAKEETTFDLTTFKYKEIDEKLYGAENKFEFELPNSKRKIEYKILTQSDEQAIEAELDGIKKAGIAVTPEITTRLRYQILSVDGETAKEKINNFINNEFFALDSKAFRDNYVKMMPDVDFESGYLCNECNWTGKVALPISTNFFWPSR